MCSTLLRVDCHGHVSNATEWNLTIEGGTAIGAEITPIDNAGTVNGGLGIIDCIGINPVGNLNVTKNPTGTSHTYGPYIYPVNFLISANAAGTTTFYTASIGSGNAISIPQAATTSCYLNPGDTLTVTFTSGDPPTVYGIGS